jgi:non-ribosomal peptide synthetase component F
LPEIQNLKYWNHFPGTTGDPHGVRLSHQYEFPKIRSTLSFQYNTGNYIYNVFRAIFNRVYWQLKVLPYLPGEILCLSSLLVDAESIAEIFAPLFGGKRLYIIPNHVMANTKWLLDSIEELKLTRIALTPLGFNSVIDAIDEIGIAEGRQV